MSQSHHPFPQTVGEFYYRGVLWNRYTTLELLQRVEKFQFRPTDVVVITFPRSGTTLTQELVWHLKHRDTVSKEDEQLMSIDERFPFLEYDCTSEGFPPPQAIDVLENTPEGDSPRLIKTHCPLFMIKDALEKAKCKIIFVVRNPKDTCVSMFNFYRGLQLFGPWMGEWGDFVQMFVQGQTKCGSWFDWTQQCVDFANERRRSNVLLMTYEELVRKPVEHLDKLSQFLHMPLTAEQKDMIVYKCKFDTMFNNAVLNPVDPATGFRFIRKGQIGEWKEYFSEHDNALMDKALESLDLHGLFQWTFE